MKAASVTEPEAGEKRTRFRVWAKRVALIAGGLLGTAVIAHVIFYTPASYDSGFRYQGKSLDEWFYAGRINFPPALDRAEILAVLRTAGTNASPFLLSKLQHRTGDSLVYFKLYGELPAWARNRLRYPILDDDIKCVSLMYFSELPDVPEADYLALADCIAKLRNPRLRHVGLFDFWNLSRTNPPLSHICEKLLDDNNAGVRLAAAICASHSRIVADSEHTKIFEILTEGLEKKAVRDAELELRGYYFRLPPGSPPPPPGPTAPGVPDQDEELQGRIKRVLERSREQLTPTERERLDAVEKTGKN